MDSVIGYALPAQFPKTGLRLTAFICIILILSSLNISETTRQEFEMFRQDLQKKVTKKQAVKPN